MPFGEVGVHYITLDFYRKTIVVYTKYYIMHIDIHDHAQEDLDALWLSDPEAAAAVQVALEQVEADPKFIDKLTTHGNNIFGANNINVKAWLAVKRFANLWRFRALDTPATSYRVVYGYHWQTRQICIFAIVHKETFDYDDLNSDVAKRILGDWKQLCP
jgi:mRNA-degrading endonuclease RelE of RelBE toxin-antitoxin system